MTKNSQTDLRTQLVAKGLVRPDPSAARFAAMLKPATPVQRHNDLTRPVFKGKK